MRGISERRVAVIAAIGAFVVGALAPASAAAQEYTNHHHRHHHYYHSSLPLPAPGFRQTDFGPTSPGVSAAVIDVRTGKLIAARGADVPRYPASLTKLMTLDLAFQALADGRLSLDTQIPISYAAAAVEPVKLGLRPGETISVRNAIMAMTTMSANDAATALGQYLGGGSLTRCAEMMTLRAHALGMAQTQFTNPSGLPNPYQVTTARDMAMLARDIVLEYPQFQSFFEIKSFDFRGRTIRSNNAMLSLYPGTTGMKTGYTDLARHNLVTSVDRNGRILVGVVLHEPSWNVAYTQMIQMLNTGFDDNRTTSQYARVQTPSNQIAPPQFDRVVNKTFEPANELPNSVGRPDQARRQWVAQLGIYRYEVNARLVALKAHRLHGYGIAQIEHIQQSGHNLWLAKLTDLTYFGAKDTCRAIRAHDGLCSVQRRDDDHLAMLAAPADGGT